MLFCDGLSTLAALVGDAPIDNGSGEGVGAGGGGGGSSGSLGGGSAGGASGAADRQWTAFMHYIVQLGQVRRCAANSFRFVTAIVAGTGPTLLPCKFPLEKEM